MYETEIRTLTPELGEFVITGQLEEAQMALKSFQRMRKVSESTFDRALYGKPLTAPRMGLSLGRLTLALN